MLYFHGNFQKLRFANTTLFPTEFPEMCVRGKFSPRTDGTVGKAAARSQTHAANLTIPLMQNAGIDIQDNNPTGLKHNEGGDSAAQAPALHNAAA